MTKKEYLDSLKFECTEREKAHRLTVASLAWDAAIEAYKLRNGNEGE